MKAHALQINHCNVMYSVDGNDETTRQEATSLFVYWLAGYSGCHDNNEKTYNNR